MTFFLSFLLLFSIREEEKHITTEKRNTNIKSILRDIKEGMSFIVKEKEIFFLLVIASMVNFFIAAFNYLAPFSNQLFVHPSSYATLLTMGAAGSIAGAVLANKLFKNSIQQYPDRTGTLRCGTGCDHNFCSAWTSGRGHSNRKSDF